MKVVYADKSVMRLCTVQREGQRAFGEGGWKRLKKRIKELEVSGCCEDLLLGPGRWHLLTRDLAGRYAGNVTDRQRIIVEQLPTDGGLSLTISVRVIKIDDYH